MVGALGCGEDPSLLRDYNRFVADNRDVLARHNQVLKAHFAREEGTRGGQAAYDHFTTALANDRSSASWDSPPSYCRTVGMIMDMAMDSRADELDLVADELGERPLGVGATCDLERAAPRERVVREDDVRDDAPIRVAEASPEPLPERIEVASAAPVSAPARAIPAVASSEGTLQAAALAVQSAAAALQAAAEALPRQRELAQRVSAPAPVAQKGIHVIEPAPIVPPAEDEPDPTE